MDKKISHFCQNCQAANKPGEPNCHKCGTRLMIITFPNSHKHEEKFIPPTFYEDHLLERVSLLEFRLKQVNEQLAMSYEFIAKQSENFEKDHLLIASFMEAVLEVNPSLSKKLSEEFALNYKRKQNEVRSENKEQKELNKILSHPGNPPSELFSHLVLEGISLLKENEEKQAFKTLERAALLSPTNAFLHIFIGEKLYKADKFIEAKKYLEIAFELLPQNLKVSILLGVIYADELNAEKSRKMLSVHASMPNTTVCANYVWGMIAAFEGNWNESIIAFKECLEQAKIPEIEYLIGSAYYQINNHSMALQYLELAVLDDQKFADAWFMISVIYNQQDKATKAENARQMAFEAKEAGSKSLKFLRKSNSIKIGMAIPFLHLQDKNIRLLNDGSLRMTRFFANLVINSID